MHQPIFRYSTVNSTVQYASILRINKMKLSEKIVCFWLCTMGTRSATFPSTHIIFMLYKLNHIEILSHHCYLAALCRPQSEIPHTQSHGRQMKKERKRNINTKHQRWLQKSPVSCYCFSPFFACMCCVMYMVHTMDVWTMILWSTDCECVLCFILIFCIIEMSKYLMYLYVILRCTWYFVGRSSIHEKMRWEKNFGWMANSINIFFHMNE